MDAMKALLRKVKASTGYIHAASNQEHDMSDFQSTVDALKQAKIKGYIESFDPHKEYQTGHDWFDNVFVGKLTAKGEALLEE